MLIANPQPTPYPDVNAMIAALIDGARSVLGDRLTGMYLDGSLASGDFDADSDIDFVAVVEDEIAPETFLALQAMHDRLALLDTPWAIQLEGSYLSRRAVRRADPAYVLYPNIERGRGERLKLADHHGQAWDIHRWVLRERGITLFGPPPAALIDPVSPDDLRRATRSGLTGWYGTLVDNPGYVNSRGYQSYLVLTMCRILYTLANGAVASKPAAMRWAADHLAPRWRPLIERAWVGRHHPEGPPDPEELRETLEMIRWVLEQDAGG